MLRMDALLTGFILIVVAGGNWATAGETSRLHEPRHPGNLRHYVSAPPGAWIYPEYRTPAYPPYGQITAAGSFQWGYFGSRHRPFVVNHSGYWRDFRQTVFPGQ